MKSILSLFCVITLATLFFGTFPVFAEEPEHDHFDIAPYFQDGKLLTGGLSHDGDRIDPPIIVYGYEFGEDQYDPFNPSDPGVNQSAGVGNLPFGDPIRYNILTSLLYWDGTGDVNFRLPAGQTEIVLRMGSKEKILTGSSGSQTGSLIAAVGAGGTIHEHFTTSLFAGPGMENVPGEPGFVEPAQGIYAFSLELTLDSGGTLYTSDPLWIIFNHGMDEEIHDAAMEHFVPEPATFTFLGFSGLTLLRRKG